MSFKLAIVVLVIATVGQGLAWPRTEVESSPNEGFAEVAISSLLKDSNSGLSVVAGIQNCVSTGVKILGLYKEKLVLKLSAFAARLSLISRTVQCFFLKNASDIHNCGLTAFNAYKSELTDITVKADENDKNLSIFLEGFRNCLKEETPAPPTTPTPRNNH